MSTQSSSQGSPDGGKKRVDVVSVRNNQTRMWLRELETLNKKVSDAIVEEQKLRETADEALDADFIFESKKRAAVACAWAGKMPDFSTDLTQDRRIKKNKH